MAQLVEHILGKDEVPGPNPGSSSRHPRDFISGLWLLIGKNESIGLVFFYYYIQNSGCLELLLCAVAGFFRQNCTLQTPALLLYYRTASGLSPRRTKPGRNTRRILPRHLAKLPASHLCGEYPGFVFLTSMGEKRMLQTPPRFYLGALVFNRENPSFWARIFFSPWSSLDPHSSRIVATSPAVTRLVCSLLGGLRITQTVV